MDIVEALHLLVDVCSSARSVLSSPEAEAVKEAIEKHFHPAAPEPPPEPPAAIVAEEAPAAFGTESNPYPAEPQAGV